MSRHLHIVSFDMPYPADYGGVIDVMNRIKAFHNNGIKIHLHYFKYNDRCGARVMQNYCDPIHVYHRKSPGECLTLQAPYFVSSRVNEDLINNLNKDNHPILFEGLHTTGVLKSINTQNRKICVRMHNNESAYYKELCRHTGNPAKKAYYFAESLLAEKYTPLLPQNCMYACVSKKDADYFKTIGLSNTSFIPIFPSWQQVESPTGVGNLCMFHGKLSVPENEKAALWLLCNVFNKVRVPFVIAGKDPSARLQKAAALCQHTCLVSNPCETEMEDLVQKAHIHILPAFTKNITGIKLKLLHALFKGRHCITTPQMVEGTGLEGACHIGSSANAIASIISQLYYQPFEEEEINLRKRLLSDTYNNEKNIQSFINYLW